MSKKAYFARCIEDYDTEKDKFAIEDIKSMGFEVVDPNEFFTQEEYDDKGMDMFFERIDECDVLFFRGLKDGRVTAGVASEVVHAVGLNIPIFELPHGVVDRSMTPEETREYLKEKGVR